MDDSTSSLVEETNEKLNCSFCGIVMLDEFCRVQHENAHKQVGWQCSICGISITTRPLRRVHENATHGFERLGADQGTKRAVKLLRFQLVGLYNVGHKLIEVQVGAEPSANSFGTEENATIGELMAVMMANRQHPSVQPPCPTCGMSDFSSDYIRNLHVSSHLSLLDGFACSICGIQKAQHPIRNAHERKAHGFVRINTDKRRKEVIKITEDEKKLLKNVGINFAEVQHTAISPRSKPWIKEKAKKAKTIESSARSLDSPAASVSRTRHSISSVITLDDSDDDLPPVRPDSSTSLPSRLITPPLSTPLAASGSSADVKANEVMRELMKRPQFVFYDFKHLGDQFNVLPVSVWSISPDCSLLVLRLNSAEWTGTIDLPEPSCQFLLSDQFGKFLLFAEPEAQPLAARFAESIARAGTFDQFIGEMVTLDFKSALFIANDEDRPSIQRLIPPHYSVV